MIVILISNFSSCVVFFTNLLSLSSNLYVAIMIILYYVMLCNNIQLLTYAHNLARLVSRDVQSYRS